MYCDASKIEVDLNFAFFYSFVRPSANNFDRDQLDWIWKRKSAGLEEKIRLSCDLASTTFQTAKLSQIERGMDSKNDSSGKHREHFVT